MRRWYLSPRILSQNLFQIPAQKHEIHLLVQMCFEGLKIVWGCVSCASLIEAARQHVSFMDLPNFCLKNWSISEVWAQGYQTEGTSWCGSSNLQLGHIGSRLLIVNNPNLAKDYVHTLDGQGWNNHLAALTPAAALLWFHPRVFRLLPNMSAFSEQYRPTMEGRGGIWSKLLEISGHQFSSEAAPQ